jgi:hypothetical protein
MASEQIAVTLLVVDALEQVGAPYVVGGSLASAIHGVVRTTLDTDIVADLALSQADPLADLLGSAFYLDRDTMRHSAVELQVDDLLKRAIGDAGLS